MKSYALGLVVAAGLSFPSVGRADEPPADEIRVTMTTEKPAWLVRRDATREQWVVECQSPCDKLVPRNDEYMVVDVASKSEGRAFKFLKRHGEAADVRFSPRSKPLLGVGLFLSIGGAALTGAGIASVVAASNADDPEPGKANQASGLGEGLLIVLGAVGIVAGVGMGLGGMACLLASGPETHVKAAATRTPTWTRTPPTTASAWIVPVAFSF